MSEINVKIRDMHIRIFNKSKRNRFFVIFTILTIVVMVPSAVTHGPNAITVSVLLGLWIFTIINFMFFSAGVNVGDTAIELHFLFRKIEIKMSDVTEGIASEDGIVLIASGVRYDIRAETHVLRSIEEAIGRRIKLNRQEQQDIEPDVIRIDEKPLTITLVTSAALVIVTCAGLIMIGGVHPVELAPMMACVVLLVVIGSRFTKKIELRDDGIILTNLCGAKKKIEKQSVTRCLRKWNGVTIRYKNGLGLNMGTVRIALFLSDVPGETIERIVNEKYPVTRAASGQGKG